jgi:hypothetical protein
MLKDCWEWLAEISKNEILRSGLLVFALATASVAALVLLERWWKKIPQKKRILQFLIAVLVMTVVIPKPLLWPQGWGIGPERSITTISVETVGKDAQGNTVKTVTTTKNDDGKTLWDWLSVLGVPLSLAILGFWLQQLQQKRAETLAAEQRTRDEALAKEQREIAADETKEEVLQVYFDRLSMLLVDKNLLAIAAKGDQATDEEQQLLDSSKDVIRARTLSILHRFKNDKDRKTSVIQFLFEANIVSKLKLSLRFADLSNANIGEAYLKGSNLNKANLSGANLLYVDLSNANLGGANLGNASCCLGNFAHANLSGADLSGANLNGADLNGANLSGANLSGAQVTIDQLNTAKLCRTKLPEQITLDQNRDCSAIAEDVLKSQRR